MGVRSEMKVLYVSGHTDDAIVHYSILKPGVAFLQKPFSREALARKIQEVLEAVNDGSTPGESDETR